MLRFWPFDWESSSHALLFLNLAFSAPPGLFRWNAWALCCGRDQLEWLQLGGGFLSGVALISSTAILKKLRFLSVQRWTVRLPSKQRNWCQNDRISLFRLRPAKLFRGPSGEPPNLPIGHPGITAVGKVYLGIENGLSMISITKLKEITKRQHMSNREGERTKQLNKQDNL